MQVKEISFQCESITVYGTINCVDNVNRLP